MPSNQLAILFMLSIDISSKWIPTHCLFLDPLTDKLVEASEPLSSNSSSCSMILSVSRSVLSGSIKIMSASCGVRSRSVLGLASSAYCTCQPPFPFHPPCFCHFLLGIPWCPCGLGISLNECCVRVKNLRANKGPAMHGYTFTDIRAVIGRCI